MTIPLTTSPGGLFRRVGTLGQILSDLYTLNVTTLPTDGTAIGLQYQGSGPANPEPDLLNSLSSAIDASRSGANTVAAQLQQIAASTLERMVFRDNPLASRTSVSVNMKELIRQMQVGSASVQSCAITLASATVSGITNNGNGFLVTSTKRGDGRVQENTFAEKGYLTCIADAQTGGASSGNETWQYRGAEAQSNPFHWEWPLGSGASTTFSSVNPQKSNSAGNLLANSGFDLFVGNTPTGWVYTAGVAGTDAAKELSIVYSGAAALKLIGGTGVNTALTQQFALTTGSSSVLQPETPYGHLILLKVDVVPASGVLTVDLIDNGGTVINDDQGVANSYTVALNTLTTSYTASKGTFRLPRVLPATIRIRYRLSTVLPGGSNLYIDHSALAALTKLYSGGPFLSQFSGSIPWIAGDTLSFTATNDRGGASSLATFQTLFDRLYAMRSLELLLPSSGSPTISDGLI